jgi:hypothetical protein
MASAQPQTRPPNRTLRNSSGFKAHRGAVKLLNGWEGSHGVVRHSWIPESSSGEDKSQFDDSSAVVSELQGRYAGCVTTMVTGNHQSQRGKFQHCDRQTSGVVTCHMLPPVLQIGYPIQAHATPRRVSYYSRSGFPSQRLSQLPESSRKRDPLRFPTPASA